MLKEYWSPEQISLFLKDTFPDDLSMNISHESIYKWIYNQKVNGYMFHEYLRQKHKKRQNRLNSNKRRMVIEGKKSIHDRPQEVTDRTEAGHWEIDLVESKSKDCYLLTGVERVYKYSVMSKSPSKRGVDIVRAI